MAFLSAMPISPLHHQNGAGGEFDYVDALIILGVLAVLAGLGYGLWRLIQKRRYG